MPAEEPQQEWTDDEVDAKLAEIDAQRLYPDLYFGGPSDVSDDPRDLINNAARSLYDGSFTERPSRRDAAGWRMPADHEPFEEALSALHERISHLPQSGLAEVMRTLAGLRHAIDRVERESVILARSIGWSWHNVGLALSISTQTVHKRYAHITPQPRVRWKRRAN